MNDEEESRQRTLDWRKVQDEVSKLRKMQEDLLLAGADDTEDTELDEAEMREINNEINRKMDALLCLMERNLRTESPSRIARITVSAPVSPIPVLTVSSPVELPSKSVPPPYLRMAETGAKVLPRGSLGTVSGARIFEARNGKTKGEEEEQEEEEDMRKLEKMLQQLNSKQRLSGRPVSPGLRKRQALTQLDFVSQERSGEYSLEERGERKSEEAVSERTKREGKAKQASHSGEFVIPILGPEAGDMTGQGTVEVVTIKKWMTRKRNPRSEEMLGLFALKSQDSLYDYVGDQNDGDLFFGQGKDIERSESVGAIGQQNERSAEKDEETSSFQRTKSADQSADPAASQEALWMQHLARLGTADSRRASDGSLVFKKARRRRRNTDGAALGSSGSTVEDSDSEVAVVQSSDSLRRRRRGSLGSEPRSGNDTEETEEWHDMLHSLGVTVLATKRLLKKKAKERKERKERKRRNSEAPEVGDLWGSTADGASRREVSREDQLEDKNWIVFVNRYSGGKLGQKVMNRFLELLPHDQVFSLIDDKGPARGFKRWLETPNYRLVVCGGDGTANWVLTALDKLATELSLAQKPPAGIVPLGTGNDLSRACGWGSSFTRCEKLSQVMRTMSQASSALWKVSVTLLEEEAEGKAKSAMADRSQGDRLGDGQLNGDQSQSGSGTEHEEEEEEGTTRSLSADRPEIGLDEQMVREGMRAEEGEMEYIMNNYFSIGVDAEIVLRFHRMREHHKELFRNVLINKGWYYGMSARAAKNERKNFKNFRDHIQVKVWHGDQEEILAINDRKIKSIIVMNIPTYGGAKCWGKEDTLASNAYHLVHKRTSAFAYVPPAIGDGMLEVVGMRGVAHLGAIVTGVSDAIRLAQATRVEITTKQAFPAHVDGEPWLLRPCRITIELQNQARLLMHPDHIAS